MGTQKKLSALAREIDGHLHAVQAALRQPIQSEIARGGLTGPQVTVLDTLFHHPGLSLKELCAEIGLAHSTVSGIIDRLESRGLLERRKDRDDGRVSRIFLSKVVQTYVEEVMPGVRLHPLTRALEVMKPAAREAALNGLRMLRQAIEKA
jgi:DNA-binding MarR family transcriptional regulator